MTGNYKTADELIAEIASSEYYKDNPHLLKDEDIYRWLYMGLKRFGLNVMQKKEVVVDVENYRAILPKDFGKLALAIHCQKDVCNVAEGDKQHLINWYYYTERIEDNFVVQASDNSAKCKDQKVIREKVWINNDCAVELCYSHPKYVKIGSDTLRQSCTSDCVNRTLKDPHYSINIKQNIVMANFKSGSLYIQYYAVPADENGLPVIPETDNGYLEEYLEYMIKRKLLEDAALSEKANLFTMYNNYSQREDRLFPMAKADTSPLRLKAFWDYIDKRRADVSKFEINFGQGVSNYGRRR